MPLSSMRGKAIQLLLEHSRTGNNNKWNASELLHCRAVARVNDLQMSVLQCGLVLTHGTLQLDKNDRYVA